MRVIIFICSVLLTVVSGEVLDVKYCEGGKYFFYFFWNLCESFICGFIFNVNYRIFHFLNPRIKSNFTC